MKFFNLLFCTVGLLSLMACGGSANNVPGQSAVISEEGLQIIYTQLVEIVGGAETDIGIQQVTDTHNCTTGNVVTAGQLEYSLIDTTVSGQLDLVSTFNACAGSYTGCGTAKAYIFNGAVTSSTQITATTVPTLTITQLVSTFDGTIELTGFATLSCVVDLSVTVDDAATIAAIIASGGIVPADIINDWSGTICGQDYQTILAMTQEQICRDL